MKSRALIGFVVAVDLAALAVLAALPPAGLGDRPGTLLLLIGLAGLAGVRPVRLPGLRHEITATHPFIFLALAALGPMPAALVAVAGVVGAAVGRKGPGPATIRFVFNLGAVCLSSVAASGAFLALGGRPDQTLVSLMLPLAAATVAYFVANTGLAAAAIALEKRQAFFSTWQVCFGWTAVSYFAGLALAAAMFAVLEVLVPWVLVLGLTSCWLLVLFYRAHAATLRASAIR